VIAPVRVAFQLLADAARFAALTFCPSSTLRAEILFSTVLCPTRDA